MSRGLRLAFVSVVVLVVCSSVPAAAQDSRGCQPLVGSLAAQLNPVAMAWEGQGYLQIGKADPFATMLVDQAVVPPTITDHGMSGEEMLTFTRFNPGLTPQDPPVPTGDAIIMTVKFSGVALPAPFMGTYQATGRISGEGIYANASGNVVIDGTAIVDTAAFPPRAQPFVWMAQIRGSICGVN